MHTDSSNEDRHFLTELRRALATEIQNSIVETLERAGLPLTPEQVLLLPRAIGKGTAAANNKAHQVLAKETHDQRRRRLARAAFIKSSYATMDVETFFANLPNPGAVAFLARAQGIEKVRPLRVVVDRANGSQPIAPCSADDTAALHDDRHSTYYLLCARQNEITAAVYRWSTRDLYEFVNLTDEHATPSENDTEQFRSLTRDLDSIK